MNSNTRLRTTIAAILRGSALGTLGVSTLGVGLAHAADSDADVADSGAIPEVVVTAERRSESLQNVPITVQAISGNELQELNLQTTEDVLRYTPNVTFASNGPGQGNIFMRGLSAGGAPNQSQSTTAPFPNVTTRASPSSLVSVTKPGTRRVCSAPTSRNTSQASAALIPTVNSRLIDAMS